MAKAKSKESIGLVVKYQHLKVVKRTSIGGSHLSRPTNKHKRRQWKAYKGQGVPS